MAERAFQAGLGTEWERVYKEGTKISALILAQVIKVNYKYNSVDLVTKGDKDTFRSSHINGGKLSAKLPLEFGGRNIEGQPYGSVTPVNVGDTVLVGFVNQNKVSPIVLSVYGGSDINSMLSRTPYDNANPKDTTLARQTNNRFKLYPSLTYDNIDGEGNRVATFTGKSFFVIDATDSINAGVTDGNHGTEYGELENSYYGNDEEIEPLNPHAPTMLMKHQGLLTQSGEEDHHITLIGIQADGTYRVSTMDKADDWRTYFEMTPDGGAKLRKQFDSKIIGKALKKSELGIDEDGTLFLRNGDMFIEVREDGIYSNGLNMDVDLSEIQEAITEQGKQIITLNMKVTQTAEEFKVLAEKTVAMGDQLTEFEAEFSIMAEEIHTKVTKAEVEDIVSDELLGITEDINSIKKDNDRLNQIMEDISDDGLVTPMEKDTLLREWNIIQDEYPMYLLQADEYKVDKTKYIKAYEKLEAYLKPIFANMEETTAIDPEVFRANFKGYYDQRLAILTSVLGVIKNLAIEAMKKASEASIDATNAWKDATQAQADASKANKLISDIASDGKLTPSEKSELKREYDSILKEHPNVLAQGKKYEVPTDSYEGKYNALVEFVRVNRLFDDMGETIAVEGEELRKAFSDYYLGKVKLLRAVTEKAKSITDKHEGRIYIAETQIKETAEYIALMAKKVETIGARVETHDAELKVQADKIASKVTASDVAKQIKDTEIGSTNLLRNTALTRDTQYWRAWGSSDKAVRERVEINGLPSIDWGFQLEKPNADGEFGYAQDKVAVTSETEYTISFWAKSVDGIISIDIQKGNGTDDPWISEAKDVGTKWSKIQYTWKTSDKTSITNYYVGFKNNKVGKVLIAGMKMESGVKATSWSPSPKDSKDDIQDEIAKTPIGGTNYIAFSSGNEEYPRLMIKNTGYYNLSQATAKFEGGMVEVTPTKVGADGYYDIGTSTIATADAGLEGYGITAVKEGDYLTFSADVQVEVGQCKLLVYLLVDKTWKGYSSDYVTPAEGKRRAVVLAKIPANTTGVLCRVMGSDGFTKMAFAKAQLETGMKSTSWTKSHFDLENDINNAVVDGVDGITLHKAWAWSPDGSEGFTKRFPEENMVSRGVIDTNTSTPLDFTGFNSKREVIFTLKDKEMYSGVRLSAKDLKVKPNSRYILQYKYKKLSGALASFGGHTTAPTWTKNIVYLDGKKSALEYTNAGSLWNSDDGKEHLATIIFETPPEIVEADLVYIQPNRGVESKGELRVAISEIVFEEVIDKDVIRLTYHPSSVDDPDKAYPKYLGTATKDSDNYKDYLWGLDPRFVDQDKQTQLNGKEGAIMKQPNAPSNPAVGLIWVDTTNVPNVPKRWDGNEWVKLTATEAKEIGAFSDSDGRDLIDRLSSAEQVITAESITNTVLSSEDFSSLFDSKANSEDLLNLATTEQLESQYHSFESLLERELGDAYSTLFERQSELEQLVSGFDFKIQQAGGINMLRNSLGFSELDFWGGESVYGRNLMLNSLRKDFRPYSGATAETTKDVPIAGTKGVHVAGKGGTSTIVGTFTADNSKYGNLLKLGVNYAHSIKVKNNSGNMIKITNNSGGPAIDTVPANTAKNIMLTCEGNGKQNIQFNFITDTAGYAFDFTVWDMKIEEGDTATPWSPAPEDALVDDGLTTTTQDNALANLGFGSGFVHKAGGVRLIQNIMMPAQGQYTMSFYMKKSTTSGTIGGAGVEIFSEGRRLAFIGAEEGIDVNEYTKYSYTFDTDSLDVSVHMVAWGNSNTTVTMSGLMFNIGGLALTWQPYPSEIYNTNVLIDINGITVKNNQTNGYTLITPTEFSGYAQVGNQMRRIFTLNGKTTEVEELQVRSKIRMDTITVLTVSSPKNTGWAFIGL